jgi:hypothetical protein
VLKEYPIRSRERTVQGSQGRLYGFGACVLERVILTKKQEVRQPWTQSSKYVSFIFFPEF